LHLASAHRQNCCIVLRGDKEDDMPRGVQDFNNSTADREKTALTVASTEEGGGGPAAAAPAAVVVVAVGDSSAVLRAWR